MSEIKKFAKICKISPKSDIFVLLLTFVLTVVFDLVVAIAVGIVLASILFMKRMADQTHIEGWKYKEEVEEDADSIELKSVPQNTLVYEITGPMFFGMSDKITTFLPNLEGKNAVILRMRSVPALDVSAMDSLESIYKKMKKKNVTLILSHVNEQPMSVMKKAGFDKMVGEENFCPHIDAALERAEQLLK